MMPQLVSCPVCQKKGYTDERTKVDDGWPCARCYIEITTGERMVWSWEVKG